jgi:hypothetical protein
MVSVTEEQIEMIMWNTTYVESKMGQKTTVVHATLPNGWEMIESSSCVDPSTYDHCVGVNICLDKIRSRVWELEGYLLQNATNLTGQPLSPSNQPSI